MRENDLTGPWCLGDSPCCGGTGGTRGSGKRSRGSVFWMRRSGRGGGSFLDRTGRWSVIVYVPFPRSVRVAVHLHSRRTR